MELEDEISIGFRKIFHHALTKVGGELGGRIDFFVLFFLFYYINYIDFFIYINYIGFFCFCYIYFCFIFIILLYKLC